MTTYLEFMKSLGILYESSARYQYYLAKLDEAERELEVGNNMLQDRLGFGVQSLEIGAAQAKKAQAKIDLLHFYMESPHNLPAWRKMPYGDNLGAELSLRLAELPDYPTAYISTILGVSLLDSAEKFCDRTDGIANFELRYVGGWWSCRFWDGEASFTRIALDTDNENLHFGGDRLVDRKMEMCIVRAWMDYLDRRFGALYAIALMKQSIGDPDETEEM